MFRAAHRAHFALTAPPSCPLPLAPAPALPPAVHPRRAFNVPLVIQMTDDEKFYWSLLGRTRHAEPARAARAPSRTGAGVEKRAKRPPSQFFPFCFSLSPFPLPRFQEESRSCPDLPADQAERQGHHRVWIRQQQDLHLLRPRIRRVRRRAHTHTRTHTCCSCVPSQGRTMFVAWDECACKHVREGIESC